MERIKLDPENKEKSGLRATYQDLESNSKTNEIKKSVKTVCPLSGNTTNPPIDVGDIKMQWVLDLRTNQFFQGGNYFRSGQHSDKFKAGHEGLNVNIPIDFIRGVFEGKSIGTKTGRGPSVVTTYENGDKKTEYTSETEPSKSNQLLIKFAKKIIGDYIEHAKLRQSNDT